MNAPIDLFKRIGLDSSMLAEQAAAKEKVSSRMTVPSWLSRLMESVAYGIVICDTHRRVILANHSALETLQDCGQPIQNDKVIPWVTTASGQRFQRALIQATEGWRRMIMLEAADGSNRIVSLSPLHLDSGDRGVLITTERTTVCSTMTLVTFADLYGFTAAETRVLLVIAKGVSPQDAADELHIAVATVRSHIKSILSKSKSDCVRSLLIKMAKLPPVVGLG